MGLGEEWEELQCRHFEALAAQVNDGAEISRRGRALICGCRKSGSADVSSRKTPPIVSASGLPLPPA
jgi:hypothetical protein